MRLLSMSLRFQPKPQCSARHARETIVMISEEEFATIRACVAKAFGFVASSYLCEALAEEPRIMVDST
jgi:hypothetical protein